MPRLASAPPMTTLCQASGLVSKAERRRSGMTLPETASNPWHSPQRRPYTVSPRATCAEGATSSGGLGGGAGGGSGPNAPLPFNLKANIWPLWRMRGVLVPEKNSAPAITATYCSPLTV